MVDEFRKIPACEISNRPEALMAYEKNYMELLKRYKDEIQEIENMMRNLREEETRFYTEELPAIRKEMEKDGVLPENCSQWLGILRDNMDKSFKISTELIEHYVTKNLDEFKNALRQEMGIYLGEDYSGL